MTYYAVVTRDNHRFVIDRFMSIEMAADKLVKERMFHKWTVLAQDGGRVTRGSRSTRSRSATAASRAA